LSGRGTVLTTSTTSVASVCHTATSMSAAAQHE
jgi:hypothetical protein